MRFMIGTENLRDESLAAKFESIHGKITGGAELLIGKSVLWTLARWIFRPL
jgi:hypothetical protein